MIGFELKVYKNCWDFINYLSSIQIINLESNRLDNVWNKQELACLWSIWVTRIEYMIPNFFTLVPELLGIELY